MRTTHATDWHAGRWVLMLRHIWSVTRRRTTTSHILSGTSTGCEFRKEYNFDWPYSFSAAVTTWHPPYLLCDLQWTDEAESLYCSYAVYCNFSLRLKQPSSCSLSLWWRTWALSRTFATVRQALLLLASGASTYDSKVVIKLRQCVQFTYYVNGTVNQVDCWQLWNEQSSSVQLLETLSYCASSSLSLADCVSCLRVTKPATKMILCFRELSDCMRLSVSSIVISYSISKSCSSGIAVQQRHVRCASSSGMISSFSNWWSHCTLAAAKTSPTSM